jgi:DNA-directed RNA polymerase specialized sigma24 family protein
MSPELQADFVAQWPELSRRLKALFGRKNVSASVRDDLVQETALRLIKMWDSVDMTRSPWPLTATIGLNLLRDRAKALATTEVLAELPDAPAMLDVADAGIARVELDRVRRAMAELTHAQRTILLDEVGEGPAATGTAAAQKMLRMRARRKLRAILERVSGLLVLRHGRASDWFGAMFASRDAVAQSAAACMACALIGTAFGAVSTPRAVEARPQSPGHTSGALLAGAEQLQRFALPHPLKSATARDGERMPAGHTGRRGATSTQASRLRPTPKTPDPLPLPTGSGDTPVPMPPTPDVPSAEPPGGPDQLPPLPLPQAHDDATGLRIIVAAIRLR